MRTKYALESLIQWLVRRLGLPDLEGKHVRRRVLKPAVVVPKFDDPSIRKLVAQVRYPVSFKDSLELNSLWNAYEFTVETFAQTSALSIYTGSIGEVFAEQLGMGKKHARYLFPDDSSNGVNLARFAVTVARIAHELMGSKLKDDNEGFVAHLGSQPMFGIAGGHIVSRFNPNIPVSLYEGLKDAYEPGNDVIEITSPVILNLYAKAEYAADTISVYALDSLVWVSGSGNRGDMFHKTLFKYVKYMHGLEMNCVVDKFEFGKTMLRGARPDMMNLSDTLYQQCVYTIAESLNPKFTLYRLLVPHVLTARAYTTQFTNPFGNPGTSHRLREKMRKTLDEIYEASRGKE